MRFFVLSKNDNFFTFSWYFCIFFLFRITSNSINSNYSYVKIIFNIKYIKIYKKIMYQKKKIDNAFFFFWIKLETEFQIFVVSRQNSRKKRICCYGRFSSTEMQLKIIEPVNRDEKKIMRKGRKQFQPSNTLCVREGEKGWTKVRI